MPKSTEFNGEYPLKNRNKNVSLIVA
jgi:hypothetical protein